MHFPPGNGFYFLGGANNLYPELGNVPMERGWAGPIDRSTTGLPWFGQLADERIHYAIGYAGHGVAAAIQTTPAAAVGEEIDGRLVDNTGKQPRPVVGVRILVRRAVFTH